MPGLVVVDSDLPGATEIRDLFIAFGYQAELREYWEAILFGDPRAVLLSMYQQTLPADERAAGLRATGYEGVLFVLGRIAPDLSVRQRLSEQRAWFLPAISGPGDVVLRVRLLLT